MIDLAIAERGARGRSADRGRDRRARTLPTSCRSGCWPTRCGARASATSVTYIARDRGRCTGCTQVRPAAPVHSVREVRIDDAAGDARRRPTRLIAEARRCAGSAVADRVLAGRDRRSRTGASCRRAGALKRAGLDAIAEAPVDRLRDAEDALAACRDAGPARAVPVAAESDRGRRPFELADSPRATRRRSSRDRHRLPAVARAVDRRADDRL